MSKRQITFVSDLSLRFIFLCGEWKKIGGGVGVEVRSFLFGIVSIDVFHRISLGPIFVLRFCTSEDEFGKARLKPSRSLSSLRSFVFRCFYLPRRFETLRWLGGGERASGGRVAGRARDRPVSWWAIPSVPLTRATSRAPWQRECVLSENSTVGFRTFVKRRVECVERDRQGPCGAVGTGRHDQGRQGQEA